MTQRDFAHVATWHHPRKLIGFDLIKGLHDIAMHRTGQKNAYAYCAVQCDPDGNILPEFNPNTMRPIRDKHELRYGQLISRAISEAEALTARLEDSMTGTRNDVLRTLVKEAQTDGFKAWMLSAASLRRMIFPNSYDGHRRCDDVAYAYDRKDSACGKAVMLEGFRPRHIKRFLTHAEAMCPTICLDKITPALLI